MIHYIYKLTCRESDDCYIGRTNNLKRRLSLHDHELKLCDRKMYHIIRDNGGFECDVLEMCNDYELSKQRERYYYELYDPSLNTNMPNRSSKEYLKNYYLNNKDAILEKQELYYKENQELIKTKNLLRYYKNKSNSIDALKSMIDLN